MELLLQGRGGNPRFRGWYPRDSIIPRSYGQLGTRIASMCEIESQHVLTWLYLELCFAACTSDTPMHQYLWMIMIDKRVRLRWQSNTTRQGWWVSPGVAGALVCRVRGACKFTGPETRVLRDDSFESKKFKTFFIDESKMKNTSLVACGHLDSSC